MRSAWNRHILTMRKCQRNWKESSTRSKKKRKLNPFLMVRNATLSRFFFFHVMLKSRDRAGILKNSCPEMLHGLQ